MPRSLSKLRVAGSHDLLVACVDMGFTRSRMKGCGGQRTRTGVDSGVRVPALSATVMRYQPLGRG